MSLWTPFFVIVRSYFPFVIASLHSFPSSSLRGPVRGRSNLRAPMVCHCEGLFFSPVAISLLAFPHFRSYGLSVPKIAASPKMRAPRNDRTEMRGPFATYGTRPPFRASSLRGPMFPLCRHCEGHGSDPWQSLFQYQRLPRQGKRRLSSQ